MSLLAVHRLLMKVVIGAALAFAWVMFGRWSNGGETATLIAAIVGVVVALATLAYLFKAPYLRRK